MGLKIIIILNERNYSVQLKKLKEKNEELSGNWHAEKMSFDNLNNLRKRLEDLRRQGELAEREGNLERVAQII